MAVKSFWLLISVCLFSANTFSQNPNHPKTDFQSAPGYQTSFRWQGGKKGQSWDQHLALLIPVSVSSGETKTYMQFDTGSPISFLYEDMVGDTAPPNDTLLRAPTIQIGTAGSNLYLEGLTVKKIGVQQQEGKVIIGTLGTDFMDQKIVVIHYLSKSIGFFNQTTPELESKISNWSALVYERGNLLFPSKILGESKLLYFDTGSSSFELLANKAAWSTLAAKDSVGNSYPVELWGKKLTAHSIDSSSEIKLAGVDLPLSSVTYIEGASDSQINRMKSMGIGGMIGNKLFLKSILVIDTRSKRYWILQR